MSFAWSDGQFTDDEAKEYSKDIGMNSQDIKNAYLETYLFIFPAWWFNSLEALFTAGMSLPWGGQAYDDNYISIKQKHKYIHLAICILFPLAWLGFLLSILFGRNHLKQIIRVCTHS